MQKSKIDWCDYTFNPVTGCLHGCEYCYARRIAERFGKLDESGIMMKYSKGVELLEPLHYEDNNGELRVNPYPYKFFPTFHRYRLDEPARKTKPQKIFVCSMADLFGEWVPDEWISEVMKAIAKAPQHKYMFLTKNPDRYFEYYEGAWQDISEEYDFCKVKMLLGTTITKQNDISKLSEAAKNFIDFVSIEPLQEEIDISEVLDHTPCCCEEPNLKWVIIGQQTGPGAKPPKDEWVQSIIDQARVAGVPVFVKRPLYDKFPIQEWPEGLK